MPHKQIDGYLSVSQVLDVIRKPFLERWRGNLGNEICDKIVREAQKFGTELHDQIAVWLKGGELTTENKQIRHLVENRLQNDFILKYAVKPLVIEPDEPYIDGELKLQGTFDCLAEINGKMAVIDWKSSSVLDPISNPLQLAAYSRLIKDHVVNSGWCVRLDRKSDIIQVKFYEDLEPSWQMFLHVLEVARFVKNRGKGNEE